MNTPETCAKCGQLYFDPMHEDDPCYTAECMNSNGEFGNPLCPEFTTVSWKDREIDLSDEQVENWRKILITLPLPPLNLALGAYALLIPRAQIVQIAQRMHELMALETELRDQRKMVRRKNRDIVIPSDNITRTRPRDPSKPTRNFRR